MVSAFAREGERQFLNLASIKRKSGKFWGLNQKRNASALAAFVLNFTLIVPVRGSKETEKDHSPRLYALT